MNEALELQNNEIIFNRAAVVFTMIHGALTEDMIDYLRNLFLKPSWKIEGKNFKLARESLGLSQYEVAERLNISLADLSKLERGVDFVERDIVAEVLKSYLQLPLN